MPITHSSNNLLSHANAAILGTQIDIKDALSPKGLLEYIINIITLGKITRANKELYKLVVSTVASSLAGINQKEMQEGRRIFLSDIHGYKISFQHAGEHTDKITVELEKAGHKESKGIDAKRFFDVCRALTLKKQLNIPPDQNILNDHGKIDLREANLVGADLRGLDLESVDLRKANLVGANLAGTNLSGANLEEANLSSANLSEANLIGTDLNRTELNQANLSKATICFTRLSKANLSMADLRNTNLTGACLFDANLSCADLSEADLTSANLNCADLTNAKLEGADLFNANLRGACLFNTNLTGADLTNANLIMSCLFGATLTNANLTNADMSETVILPKNRIGRGRTPGG